MRLFDASAAAALLTCMAGSASAQSAAAKGDSAAKPFPDGEIVVTGRRDSQKYRLPPQFRTAPEAGDRWRRMLARDWSCHNVGPRGCGMKPIRFITIRSDGSVQIGDPSAGK